MKSFFKGILAAKSCLRSESAPLMYIFSLILNHIYTYLKASKSRHKCAGQELQVKNSFLSPKEPIKKSRKTVHNISINPKY